MKLLEDHPWTGNIRELRNVIERLVIMAGDTIRSEDIKKYLWELDFLLAIPFYFFLAVGGASVLAAWSKEGQKRD